MMRRVGIRGERGDGKVVKGKGEEGKFREGVVNGYYLTEMVSKAESRGQETTGGGSLWCGCGRGWDVVVVRRAGLWWEVVHARGAPLSSDFAGLGRLGQGQNGARRHGVGCWLPEEFSQAFPPPA
jgi:hypothetical protein